MSDDMRREQQRRAWEAQEREDVNEEKARDEKVAVSWQLRHLLSAWPPTANPHMQYGQPASESTKACADHFHMPIFL